jgi:hypothetical protein
MYMYLNIICFVLSLHIGIYMHITSNKSFVKGCLLDETWFEALYYSVSDSNSVGAKAVGSGEVGLIS